MKRLEGEIKGEEGKVQGLSELGTKISRESAAAQAREIFSKQEKVRKRWRYVFTEVNLKKTEINSNNNHNEQAESTVDGG